MLNALPTLQPTDRRFVDVHRLVSETLAARTVALTGEGPTVLAAPVDGGEVVSETLAISGPRATYLGLGEAAALIHAPGAGRERLMALAMADRPDLSGVKVTRGSRLAEAATELAKLAERLPAMIVLRADPPGGMLSAAAEDVLAFRRSLAGTMAPVASAPVPLKAGARAKVTAFRNAVGGCASAVMIGEARPGMLVRVHSSCITGDVFGSVKCDCGAQLDMALHRIAADGGVLIYTAQEGRGIGLVNKLRAYGLQDAGLDTVDANLALGYHDDERDYVAAATILTHLGLADVRLLTNNPLKVEGLAAAGLKVEPEALITPETSHNAQYLDTKRRRSGHTL